MSSLTLPLDELDGGEEAVVVDGSVRHELDVHQISGGGDGRRDLTATQACDDARIGRASVPHLSQSGAGRILRIEHVPLSKLVVFVGPLRIKVPPGLLTST